MIWYDARKVIPAESVDCVIVTETGMVTNAPYSKKHQAFNCSDDGDNSTAIDVVYWITREDFDRHIKESVEKEMKDRDTERPR